jgi:unsaturated rhamnogalacturonyl hydrolase
MTDPATGLLYHAWDDSKQAKWANPETGLSAEFWGRAIGWYAVAILDILDCLPADYPKRQEFIDAEIDIIKALVRYQDESTGLWYQVVNRGDDPANWHETSCTSLYTYSISKAIKTGILGREYETYAKKGYEGVINSLTYEGEELIVSNICIGTGVGPYEFYLKRPTVANDLHGMGAFVLMCSEYWDAFRE